MVLLHSVGGQEVGLIPVLWMNTKPLASHCLVQPLTEGTHTEKVLEDIVYLI